MSIHLKLFKNIMDIFSIPGMVWNQINCIVLLYICNIYIIKI